MYSDEYLIKKKQKNLAKYLPKPIPRKRTPGEDRVEAIKQCWLALFTNSSVINSDYQVYVFQTEYAR